VFPMVFIMFIMFMAVSARVPRATAGTFQVAVVGRAVHSAAQINFKLRYATTMGTLGAFVTSVF